MPASLPPGLSWLHGGDADILVPAALLGGPARAQLLRGRLVSGRGRLPRRGLVGAPATGR
jgi:hypothetical protein